MTSQIRLSIGVPAYNQGQFLEATLDSLLSQTIEPFEIVISNNYSTDNTSEILKKFHGKVKVIQPASHLDMMAHWNFLISHLRGDWFSLLSSDDIAKHNYVETLLTGISRSDKAVLVRGGWETIDSEGRVIEKRQLLSVKSITRPPQTLYEQLYGSKVNFSAFAVRKSTWEAVGGFPEECTLAGDWGFWLRISPLGDFVREIGIISQYRTDYRPVLQQRRVVAWLKDEFHISTVIIPGAAQQMRLANQRRLVDAKRKRFFQCVKLASIYLDPLDRDGAISVFTAWAEAIGLTEIGNDRIWLRFVAGERMAGVTLFDKVKSKSRAIYVRLRRLEHA